VIKQQSSRHYDAEQDRIAMLMSPASRRVGKVIGRDGNME